MFKKNRPKSGLFSDSRESVESKGSSGNQVTPHSSRENIASGTEMRLIDGGSSGSLNRSVQFQLHYLGMVQDLHSQPVGGQDTRVQIIDKIEEAQIENKIHIKPAEDDLVKMVISKHGVKVMKTTREEVLQRHPLHTVAQLIEYIDTSGRTNLALKIVRQIESLKADCYVFQCHNVDQASRICRALQNVFEAVVQSV
ncbi:unnamed protein product [Owenia fusiformis]|uniref:Uncharacterized protein n=1 Tax=Owenia fusiformis TaxID=6347 RepID=A0A8J1UCC3_OWEFU|nr:unnamed protein product [Owenia fusiformis]